MSAGLTRTIAVPPSGAAQTISLLNVLDTDPNVTIAINRLEILKTSGAAGDFWISIATDDPASVDGNDIDLVPDGSQWGSFEASYSKFRQRAQATRPNIDLSVLWVAGGAIQVKLI